MQTRYTASDARANFYTLLKQASLGLNKPEIVHRDGQSIIMMSLEEYESWQETLDILSNKKEYQNILASKKDKNRVSLDKAIADSAQ